MVFEIDFPTSRTTGRRHVRGRRSASDRFDLSPAPQAPVRFTSAQVGQDPARARATRVRLTWSARFISSIGDGLVFVAFPLLATSLTHNPLLIAAVAFATRLPWLIVGIPAGALVDRVSRRRLLTVVEIARMSVLLLLAAAIVAHHLVLAELYVAAFIITSLGTMFDAATMAVLPQLVAEADLVHANSRLQVAQVSGEQFIGPALGGVLFAVAVALPVAADGVSFAASAALLMIALRPPARIGRHARPRNPDAFVLEEPAVQARGPSFIVQLIEGLRWLANEPRLRLLCGLIASFAFCQGLSLGILVIYCTRVLHLTKTAFGLFIATVALGDIVGAWVAPRVTAKLGTGRTLIFAGVLGGAALLVIGTTSITGIAVLAAGVEALAAGGGMVANVTLRQRLIPLALVGRVSSAMRSATISAAALATLVGGGLVVLMGSHAPFAIGGAIQLVTAVLIGGALARRLAADERNVIDVTETLDLREPAVVETV